MADQDDRAVIFAEHFLQQVEGFDIEIVGRLVEHQQIVRPGEQLCQQQPVALPAGEVLHLRACLTLLEQEVTEVGDDMLRLAVHEHGIAATGAEC